MEVSQDMKINTNSEKYCGWLIGMHAGPEFTHMEAFLNCVFYNFHHFPRLFCILAKLWELIFRALPSQKLLHASTFCLNSYIWQDMSGKQSSSSGTQPLVWPLLQFPFVKPVNTWT